MNNDLSNNEIKKIISRANELTIIGDLASNKNALENLLSILNNTNNNSTTIGIIVDKTYYIYDSHNNEWKCFGEVLPCYFKLTQFYVCTDDDFFNIRLLF